MASLVGPLAREIAREPYFRDLMRALTPDFDVTSLGSASLGLYAAAAAGVGIAAGGLWRTSLAAEVAAVLVTATFLLDLLAPPLRLPDWVHQLALTAHMGAPMIGTWDVSGVVACLGHCRRWRRARRLGGEAAGRGPLTVPAGHVPMAVADAAQYRERTRMPAVSRMRRPALRATLRTSGSRPWSAAPAPGGLAP